MHLSALPLCRPPDLNVARRLRCVAPGGARRSAGVTARRADRWRAAGGRRARLSSYSPSCACHLPGACVRTPRPPSAAPPSSGTQLSVASPHTATAAIAAGPYLQYVAHAGGGGLWKARAIRRPPLPALHRRTAGHAPSRRR